MLTAACSANSDLSALTLAMESSAAIRICWLWTRCDISSFQTCWLPANCASMSGSEKKVLLTRVHTSNSTHVVQTLGEITKQMQKLRTLLGIPFPALEHDISKKFRAILRNWQLRHGIRGKSKKKKKKKKVKTSSTKQLYL